jgi:hypothetical protein
MTGINNIITVLETFSSFRLELFVRLETYLIKRREEQILIENALFK